MIFNFIYYTNKLRYCCRKMIKNKLSDMYNILVFDLNIYFLPLKYYFNSILLIYDGKHLCDIYFHFIKIEWYICFSAIRIPDRDRMVSSSRFIIEIKIIACTANNIYRVVISCKVVKRSQCDSMVNFMQKN